MDPVIYFYLSVITGGILFGGITAIVAFFRRRHASRFRESKYGFRDEFHIRRKEPVDDAYYYHHTSVDGSHADFTAQRKR